MLPTTAPKSTITSELFQNLAKNHSSKSNFQVVLRGWIPLDRVLNAVGAISDGFGFGSSVSVSHESFLVRD